MTVQELIDQLQALTPEQKQLPVYTHETGAVRPADEMAIWETQRGPGDVEYDHTHPVVWIGS